MATNKRPGYRATRSTVVLALHSTVLALKDKDGSLRKALGRLAEEFNFDLARSDDPALEGVFAALDEEMTKKVTDEWHFAPTRGCVRDLGGHTGTCALCGKGDSKDTGDNRDQLRYQFRLSNMANGTELWVGSTCIVNAALRVDGAATSEAAEQILEKQLRVHISLFKQQAWRAENPDHVEMDAHWEDFRFLGSQISRWWNWHREIEVLGINLSDLRRQVYSTMKPFRTAVRFHARKEFLTPAKTEPWVKAKSIISTTSLISAVVARFQAMPSFEERVQFCERIVAVQEAQKKQTAPRQSRRQGREVDDESGDQDPVARRAS